MLLELRSDPRELDRLARAVEEFGARYELTEQQVFHLQLALEEVVTNIIVHGDDIGEHPILVSLGVETGEVCVEVQDQGRAFDPLSVPAADLSRPLSDRAPGGLGIHLVRAVMDSLYYRREGDRNILVMKKRVAA
jgi:anti-sigma regulatory factor (Ser/Thr protein kinase)